MTQDRIKVTLSVPEDTPLTELFSEGFRLVEISEPETKETADESVFSEGDFALDKNEPTPSPEANTVKVTEVTDQRADEYVVEETGNTVKEHNPNHSGDERVIIGHYPNMGSPDKKFAFPESRLQQV